MSVEGRDYRQHPECEQYDRWTMNCKLNNELCIGCPLVVGVLEFPDKPDDTAYEALDALEENARGYGIRPSRSSN